MNEVAVYEGALPPGVAMTDAITINPLEQIEPQLALFRAAATDLEEQAARGTIDSAQRYELGTEFLSVCSEKWKQLEQLRKAVKGPIDDYGAYIQAQFLPVLKQIKAARDLIETRMLGWKREQDRIAAEAAARLKREQEEAAQRLAAEEEAKGNTAVAGMILDAATTPTPAVKVSTVPTGKNSMGRSTQVKKTWVGEVDSPMVVLRAIVEGKLPVTLVGSWSQSELNRVAGSLKVTGTHLGIKVFERESLTQR